MKIVICDDCVEDLQYIEQLLGQYTEAAPGADFVVENIWMLPSCTTESRRASRPRFIYWI